MPGGEADDDVDAEFNPDDRECEGDAGLEISETTSAADDFSEEVVGQAGGFKRNLWVFARPLSRYDQILRQVCGADSHLQISILKPKLTMPLTSQNPSCMCCTF